MRPRQRLDRQRDQEPQHHRQQERIPHLHAHIQRHQIGPQRHHNRTGDNANRIDAIEPVRLHRVHLQRPPVPGHLTQAPRKRQRHHDRRDHSRTQHPNPEHQVAHRRAQERSQRLRHLPHRGQRRIRIAPPDRRGACDQDRRHDQLGQQRPDRRIPSRRRQMLRLQPLIGDSRLLVEHHPRHDDRADIRRCQIQVLRIAVWDIHRPGQ